MASDLTMPRISSTLDKHAPDTESERGAPVNSLRTEPGLGNSTTSSAFPTTSHKIPAVRSTASIGVFVSLTFKKARNIKKSRLFLPLKTWWVASSDVCQTGYALWIRAKSFYSAHMRYEKRLVKPVGLTTRKGGEYDQSG